jgi:hypothetical protein
VYNKRPKPPQKEEWTDIADCVMFEGRSLALGRLGREVFNRSISNMPAKSILDSHAAAPSLDIVPAAKIPSAPELTSGLRSATVDSIDWHVLLGSRVRKVQNSLMSVGKHFNLIAAAIVIGCEQTLTHKLFAGAVTLFDYVSDYKHPCLNLMQFLPSLLQGEHAASRIICASVGWDRPSEVLRFHPKEAACFRSLCVGSSIRAYIRHFYRFKLMPWPLALIGDPDVREEVKSQVGFWFCTMCKYRLGAGFGLALRDLTGDSLELIHATGVLSPYWRGVLNYWARELVDVDTDDLELMNGASKRQNCDANRWELVCARDVIHAAKRLRAMEAATTSKDAKHEDGEGEATDKKVDAAGNASRLRSHKSGIQLFHKLCSKRDAELGVMTSSPASKDYWAQVRGEWDVLSDNERLHFGDSVSNDFEQFKSTRKLRATTENVRIGIETSGDAGSIPPPAPYMAQASISFCMSISLLPWCVWASGAMRNAHRCF